MYICTYVCLYKQHADITCIMGNVVPYMYVYVCVLFEWKITDPDTIWGMIHSRGSPAFGRSCIFSMEPYLMNVLEQVDYVLFVAWVYSRFGRLKNQSKPNRNILKYLTNLTKIKKQGATCFVVSLALPFSLALTLSVSFCLYDYLSWSWALAWQVFPPPAAVALTSVAYVPKITCFCFALHFSHYSCSLQVMLLLL